MRDIEKFSKPSQIGKMIREKPGILIYHTGFASEIKKLLEREVGESFKVEELDRIKDEIPKGYAIYLLHGSRIDEEKILKLRKKQANSLICLLFGGNEGEGGLKNYLEEFNGQVYDEVILCGCSYYEERHYEKLIDTLKKATGKGT